MSRLRIILTLLTTLCLVDRAHATVTFFTTNDICYVEQSGATTDNNYWPIQQNSTAKECLSGSNAGATCTVDSACPSSVCVFNAPQISKTIDTTLGNNICSIRFHLPSGKVCLSGSNVGVTCTTDTECPSSTCSIQRAYLQQTIAPADATMYAGLKLYVAALPASRRRVLSFTGSTLTCQGGTNSGVTCTTDSQCPGAYCSEKTACLLTVETDTDHPGKYAVKAFYENSDVDVNVGECSASQDMDGTECGGSCTAPARWRCAIGKPSGVCNGTNFNKSCTTDFECAGKACVAGTNDGATCTVTSQCPSGTCKNAHCSATVCRQVCQGGSNVDVECTTASECPSSTCGKCVNECNEHNPGEAGCGAAPTATASNLDLSTWYEVSMFQDNVKLCLAGSNAEAVCTNNSECPSSSCAVYGKAKCGLWLGTGGLSPASVDKGSQTRKQGKCDRGERQNFACAIDGNCPTASTPTPTPTLTATGGTATPTPVLTPTPVGTAPCTITDIQSVTQVRWGTDDKINAALDYTIDDEWVDDATLLQNWWMQSLLPNGDGSLVDWNNQGSDHTCGNTPNQFACLNDSSAGTYPTGYPDNSTTRLERLTNIALPDEQLVQLSNPATPSPTPTILAVAAVVLAQDRQSATNNSAVLKSGLKDDSVANASIPMSAAFDTELFSDGGSTAIFHPMPAFIRPLKCTNSTCSTTGAWNITGVNGAEIYIAKTADTGTVGADVAVSSVIGETLMRAPDPPIPTIIPDRTGDGLDTVTVTGDSTVDDKPWYDNLVALLLEPQNIIDCSRGGATMGDVQAHIVRSGASIAKGTDTFMCGSSAYKGTKTNADILLIDAGVNTLNSLQATPNNPTAFQGLGQDGYCLAHGVCAGGSNAGARCYVASQCPSGTCAAGAQQSRPCTCEKGIASNWQAENNGQYFCKTRTATFPSVAPASLACPCTTNSDCRISPADADGTCANGSCTQAFSFTNLTANSTNPAYWVGSGCTTSPTCDALCLTNSTEDALVGSIDSIQAQIQSLTGPPIAVWLIPPPPESTSCSAVEGFGLNCSFSKTMQQMALHRMRFKRWAAQHPEARWIDLWGRFARDCPQFNFSNQSVRTSSTTCIRDMIHWTSLGWSVAALAVQDCLTNRYGTADGICTTGKCSRGQVPDVCSANADCDTYHCNLVTP